MNIRFIGLFVVILFLASCAQINSSDATFDSTITSTSLVKPTEKQNATKNPPINPTQEWINEEINSGKEQGEIIIKSIEKYFVDYGYYPESLINLVPKYLKEIPLTTTEQEFYYYKSQRHVFSIGFNLSRKGDDNIIFYCVYHKNYDNWECGTYLKH